jgi:hypothetical protein
LRDAITTASNPSPQSAGRPLVTNTLFSAAIGGRPTSMPYWMATSTSAGRPR